MSEEGWEQKYVKEAFDTNWVVPMGPNVNAFEKDLEEFVNDVRCQKEDVRYLPVQMIHEHWHVWHSRGQSSMPLLRYPRQLLGYWVCREPV